MHELSITQSILNQAIAEATKHKAKHIKKIKLQFGEASAIVPECVQFYFNTMKKGTIAENGVLDIEVIPVKLRCPKCKKEIATLPRQARNDNVGSYEIACACKKGVEIISGNDMIIEYIDVE